MALYYYYSIILLPNIGQEEYDDRLILIYVNFIFTG